MIDAPSLGPPRVSESEDQLPAHIAASVEPDGTTVITPVPTIVPPPTTVPTTTIPPDAERYRVRGYVHAGPVCPVEQFPPDPDCADRPVPGAVLVIATEDGAEVTRVESDREGRFSLHLANGRYVLRPQPVDGLLGTAPEQSFVVDGGPVELDVAYDTGIR